MPNPMQDQVSPRALLAGLVSGGGAAAVAVTIRRFLPDGTAVGHPSGTFAELRSYPRKRLAGLADLATGKTVDFEYPLEGHSSFLVKLGEPAVLRVGPEEDVVAFSYLCTRMGCPLTGRYRDDHKVIGPCPCHFSTFDLRRHGMLTLGQATESLPQIVLEVEDGDVWAVGVLGLVFGARDNLLDASVAKGTA
jgi:arsenite oxidase small subunit